jgi:hypothetical protein
MQLKLNILWQNSTENFDHVFCKKYQGQKKSFENDVKAAVEQNLEDG